MDARTVDAKTVDAKSAASGVEEEASAQATQHATVHKAAALPMSALNGTAGEPIKAREVLTVLALVALCDLTIYRGQGFAGIAALLIGSPILLWFASARRTCSWAVWAIGLMLGALALRTLWCGSPLQVAVGFCLIAAFATVLVGRTPYVSAVLAFAAQSIPAGLLGFVHYGRSIGNLTTPRARKLPWLNVTLPAAAVVVFSLIFLLANPDLFATVSTGLERLLSDIRQWLIDVTPQPTEVIFWIVAAWLVIGLVRPIQDLFEARTTNEQARSDYGKIAKPSPSPLYPAFRNTLVVVIVLFACYLVFELATLWFREFPPGFYYAGYAHQGAAWLTIALALATASLSMIFRGQTFRDPRVVWLKRLAWLWSLENFILAAAVYNRMWIYVDFNGLTRMRTIGLFGITAVVVGFVLVLGKIALNKDVSWLLRRHMWTLAMTVFVFSLTPVDTLVHRYNVRRIMSGDPAPSVQISVHPISSEGYLVLTPLLDCEDTTIRAGVAALLADRHEELEEIAIDRRTRGWTAYQVGDQLLLDKLRTRRGQWQQYQNPDLRTNTLNQFHDYAYQWY